MQNMTFIEGILPGRIEIIPPPIVISRVHADNRTAKMEALARSQNLARVRNSLKISPTNRPRRGNRR